MHLAAVPLNDGYEDAAISIDVHFRSYRFQIVKLGYLLYKPQHSYMLQRGEEKKSSLAFRGGWVPGLRAKRETMRIILPPSPEINIFVFFMFVYLIICPFFGLNLHF
jgi:hypothetical protein